MTKVKEYSSMTKDRLMTYTFVALLILAGVSFFSFGITSIIACAIAVLVAVGIDFLLSKVTVDSPLNIMSAAVFGLIVALSYSLGIPTMHSVEVLPLLAPDAYLFVALISAVGMVLFKKIQGLFGRKFVNPAATAKFLVLLPFLNTVLLAQDHLTSGMLGLPSLAGPIGYSVIGNNGLDSFGNYIQSCFGDPSVIATSVTQSDIMQTLLLQKYHGWVGGVSTIAVIAVGIALIVLCRRYIKWRITLTYLATIALFALVLGFVYGGDPLLRVAFHLFVGSSIFMAFFMATDPASTPVTYLGQVIFGVGLGILTVLIQVYLNFFGGSILALILMNLTSPTLDKIGKLRPRTESITPKLPKAKQFTSVKVTECIRCGACMRVCCHRLSPILIKEAFDKTNVERLAKLQADLCEGCGHCSFVCPARIDLKGSILRSKALLRKK
jgi:electron transport complex protein RnfD